MAGIHRRVTAEHTSAREMVRELADMGFVIKGLSRDARAGIVFRPTRKDAMAYMKGLARS